MGTSTLIRVVDERAEDLFVYWGQRADRLSEDREATRRSVVEACLQALGRDNRTWDRTWPPGVQGSVTHDGRSSAAAATSNMDIAAVGVDLCSWESGRQLGARHLSRAEREAYRAPIDDRASAAFFAAKESAFKALNTAGLSPRPFLRTIITMSRSSFTCPEHPALDGYVVALPLHALGLAVVRAEASES